MEKTKQAVKLIEKNGILYVLKASIFSPENQGWFNGDAILIVQHNGGDVDTIKWPNPNSDHLKSALYDARETGLIDDVKSVTMPDETEFQIDQWIDLTIQN